MLCPGCFQQNPGTPVCPACGYDESLRRSPLVLAHHTLLYAGRYRVGRLLGKPGGFGITYLGWDERLLKAVAIKEYLPRDLSGRDVDHLTVTPHSGEDAVTFAFGLGRFLEEAHTLARLDHPNLVRDRDYFEAHGTAYLVMNYYPGLTLSEYLTSQPGGKISEAQAVAILLPILDGLREVHAQGFLHRDIKPQNIYLTTGNRPILLDFGAARIATSEQSRTLTVVLSEGYAPVEQYQRNGRQGPWTDVYGAAATLYQMVTGQSPPPATERMGDSGESLADLSLVSPALAAVIEHGLRPIPAERIQSIQTLQSRLLGQTATRAPPAPESAQPADRRSRPHKGWVAALLILAILLMKSWTGGPPHDVPAPVALTRPATPAEYNAGLTEKSGPAPLPAPPTPSPIPSPALQPVQPRAIADGERIKRLMLEQNGEWTAERYRKASLAFEAALQADPVRRREWRQLKEHALQMARTLPAPSDSNPAPPRTGPVADGERVRGKMRGQEGVWTADRYRRAVAAFKAAEQAEPSRRDYWRAEQEYATQMTNTLQNSEPEPVPPAPVTATEQPGKRPASARRAIEDGERIHRLMTGKSGEWTALRYRQAIAAFQAAERADPARKAQWRTATAYAAKMAERLAE